MTETFEQMVERIANEMPRGFLWKPTPNSQSGILKEDAIYFATRLRDELAKGQQPVAYGVTYDGEEMIATCITRTGAESYAKKEGAKVVLLFTSPVIAAPAGLPDVIREGVEAAFEQRQGWQQKIAAANRALNRTCEINAWHSQPFAATAAPADAAKDADRYRWLRDNQTQVEDGEEYGSDPFVNLGFCREGFVNLDSAIDAAMASSREDA